MKAETIWSRLSWPQVAAMAITVAGGVAVAVWAPIPWAELPWEAILGVALSIGGVGALGVSGPIVRPRGSTPPPPPTLVRRKTEGFVDPHVLEYMGWLVLWTVLTLIAAATGGES